MLAFGRDERSKMRARVGHNFEQFNRHSIPRRCRGRPASQGQGNRHVIDLAGITGNCRTGVLALRPSPVQVNYLGFPATMGADYLDYLIADRTVIAPDQRTSYAESIVLPSDTYMPHDAARQIAVPPSRREAALPEHGFVFLLVQQ